MPISERLPGSGTPEAGDAISTLSNWYAVSCAPKNPLFVPCVKESLTIFVKPEKSKVCSVSLSLTVNVWLTVELSANVPVKVTVKVDEPPAMSGARSMDFKVNGAFPVAAIEVVPAAKNSKREVSVVDRPGRLGLDASHT